MAKRELSNTLKNLKFMQRGAPKEETPKEEETKAPQPQGNFISPGNVSRKCVVVMEGDPHPGTIKGRMSFQNFNPSVDKLNNDDANGHEAEASTSSSFQNRKSVERKNGPTEDSEMDMGYSDGELKRKQQPEEGPQTTNPKKQKKKSQANNQPSASENRSSQKKPKRDKLDWNVLVPPKSLKVKGGKRG